VSVFPTRILLATDGSPDAGRAAETAVELAEKLASELHVVHVGEYLPTIYAQTEEEPAEVRRRAGELLDEQVRRIREAGGAVTDVHFRLGRPAEQIVGLSEELDAGLIVVGSRGLSGLKRAVLGSVSESVVRHAHCPVFVARGD
jgi:nucleotide-binding universal stress UspA family protein